MTTSSRRTGADMTAAVRGAGTAKRFPVAAVSLFVLTGAVTAAQFVRPELVDTLRRDPEALADGEWWRAVTPLLVQVPAWQTWVTVPGILALGIPVERTYGTRATLVLYLLPGLVGEAVGYLWQPHGAGNSIADVGLAGSLVAWLFLEAGRRDWPPQLLRRVRVWGGAVLAGAVVDTAFRDIHGLPLLAGAAVGAALSLRRRRRRRSS